MGLCKTCIHFKRWDSEDNRTSRINIKFGGCEKIIYRPAGEGYQQEFVYEDSPRLTETANIHALSEWGDEVEIGIGEDFGCIHHQEAARELH